MFSIVAWNSPPMLRVSSRNQRRHARVLEIPPQRVHLPEHQSLLAAEGQPIPRDAVDHDDVGVAVLDVVTPDSGGTVLRLLVPVAS